MSILIVKHEHYFLNSHVCFSSYVLDPALKYCLLPFIHWNYIFLFIVNCSPLTIIISRIFNTNVGPIKSTQYTQPCNICCPSHPLPPWPQESASLEVQLSWLQILAKWIMIVWMSRHYRTPSWCLNQHVQQVEARICQQIQQMISKLCLLIYLPRCQ